MGRWMAVRIIAFTLRRGVCAEHAMEALAKSYPHQDGAWRLAVIEDAQARNKERMARR